MKGALVATVAVAATAILYALALRPKPRRILFSCTTFFDFEKQDKWAAFCRAMDSILEQHTPGTLSAIETWVVVNEFSDRPRRDWAAEMRTRYPFCRFIQKGSGEKGQAASMNRILGMLPGYTYWIHWEETWYCRAPCIDRMIDVMDHSRIAQLQVTQLKEEAPNWLDSAKHPRIYQTTPSGTEFVQILPATGTEGFLNRSAHALSDDYFPHWPLYSLLPSINRVEACTVGSFSVDPTLWPIKFEWDYARRWLREGGTKAVLPDGPVVRDNSAHKSTYS